MSNSLNNNTNSIPYARLYSLFTVRTPLAADCGAVCGGRCCRRLFRGEEDAPSGMLLFPGESAFRQAAGWTAGTLLPSGQDSLFLCGGVCRREERPLACRIFPLFPALEADGRIRAVYDPRAWRVCPLVRMHRFVPLERPFVRAVRQAGREIARTPAGRDFLARQTEEIREFNRFLRLDRERAPICRKKTAPAGENRRASITGKEFLS